MSEQLGLFDAAAGTAAKEEAITRVEANASRAWLDEAKAALLGLCVRPQFVATITSDDVWVVLQLKRIAPPHEPRAMGPVMRWAVSEGAIRATDRFVPSELPQNHRRPVRGVRGGEVSDWYSEAREADGRTDEEVLAEIRLRRDVARSQFEEFKALVMEHRECGKPKYDGCFAHFPWMAHCRADGNKWPCDVERLRQIVWSYIAKEIAWEGNPTPAMETWGEPDDARR